MKISRCLPLLTISVVILCLGLIPSCSGSSEPVATADVEPEVVREVTFSVPEVTCASCLMSIRKEVITEPGVVSMGGDADKKTVVVRLSADAPGGDTNLIDAIKRAGFEATAVKE